MDLQELDSIDTSDKEAVKRLQKFLKTRGFYVGPKTEIDGNWGRNTTDAASRLRAELKETAKTARDTAVANQETNSPLNNALRGVTEFGPYAGGAALGAWAGHKGGQKMTSLWDRHAAETKAMAGDPKISGVVGEGKMGSMRGTRNAITGAQFLAPAALLGSAEAMRHVADNFEGETKKWINLGANADQGVALGLAAHQLIDLKNRIASPADAADEARIETRAAAERNPAAPPTTRPNSERLIAAAKAAGATGKLTKTTAAEYLAKNVTDANRAAVAAELGVTKGQQVASTVKKLLAKPGASSIIAPLIGGTIAYDAASSEAEAAGATPGEARTQGAIAGTGAAGATAGAGYSLSKLLEKVPTLGRSLGIGGGMSMPLAAMEIGPGTPEEANLERSRLAQNWPRIASMLGLHDEMGQMLPERNMGKTPELPQAPMGAGLPSASALQIPEGIPLPNPEGMSPYPELRTAMAAGRRPQLPYAPMGFGGGYR